jgi:hypothetical protein
MARQTNIRRRTPKLAKAEEVKLEYVEDDEELVEPESDSANPEVGFDVFYMHAGDELPTCETYSTLEEAREAIKNILAKPKYDLWLCVVQGTRWNITKGPYRYMVKAAQLDSAVPLFDIPEADELEFEENGLIRDSQHPDAVENVDDDSGFWPDFTKAEPEPNSVVADPIVDMGYEQASDAEFNEEND